MARFKEQDHPFYKPLWVRVLIVVVVAGWLAFEVMQNSGGLWIGLAAAFLAYAVYMFFITWPKDGGSRDDGSPPA